MANNGTALSIVVGVVDKFTSPLRDLRDRVDAVNSPLRTMRQRFQALSRGAGLDRISARLGQVKGRVMGVGDAIGKTAGRFGTLFGGAIAGSGALLANFTGVSNEIKLAADRLKTTTDNVQELNYIGRKFKIEERDLNDYFKDLGVTSDDYWSEDGGEGAEAYKRLGFSRQDIADANGDLQKLFDMVAPRIAEIQNSAAAGNIVEQLFSGDATRLLPMIQAYAKNQEALRKEARDSGAVISEDDIDASYRFNQIWTVLIERLKGVRNIIGSEVTPIISELATALGGVISRLKDSGAITDFARKIRDQVPTWDELKTGISEAREQVQPFLDAWNWLADRFGATRVVMASLAAFIFGPLVAALATLAASVLSLGVTIALTPIGWILAGLAGLAAAAALIVSNWSGISAWWSGLWSEVTNAFDEGFIKGVGQLLLTMNPLNLLVSAVKNIGEWLGGPEIWTSIGDSAVALGRHMVDGILSGIMSGWKMITDYLDDKWQATQRLFDFGGGVNESQQPSAPDRINTDRDTSLSLPGGSVMPGNIYRPAGASSNSNASAADTSERGTREMVVTFEGLPSGVSARVNDERGVFMGTDKGAMVPQ